MESLWPKDLTVNEAKAPVAILREQASLLGEATRNIVQDKVVALSEHPLISPDSFGYNFYIAAPSLGNYRYELFIITHSFDFYPVHIYPDTSIIEELHQTAPDFDLSADFNLRTIFEKEGVLVAKSENEFIEILKAIFHSKRTGTIVQALIAQSTDYSSK